MLEEKKSEAVAAKNLLESTVARTGEKTGNSLSEETIRGESRLPCGNVVESSALGLGSRDDYDPNVKRSGSPIDSETQGWLVPKKIAKLNTEIADQASAEVTMRKTRVSVRTRSESSMVCITYL